MDKNKHFGLTDSLIEAAKACMSKEELVGNQKKLDANKNGKLDAEDFKKLRGETKDKDDVKEGYASNAQRKAVWASRNDEKEAMKRKMKKEDVQIDEAFPTVADAMKKDKEKSTFDKKKISTGTVYTKKYKEKEKEEKDEKGEMDEAMDAPFDGPYAKKKIAVPGKQGIGPSTAKHLAKMAMAKQIKKLNK